MEICEAIVAALLRHRSVAEAHVMRNPESGRYSAFVALSNATTGQQILRKLGSRFSRLGVSLRLHVCSALPRLPSGEIDEKLLERIVEASSSLRMADELPPRLPEMSALPSVLDGGALPDTPLDRCTLPNLLQRAAARANGPGLSFVGFESGNGDLSYAGLYELAAKASGAICRAGVSRGDTVLFFLSAARDFMVAFWGCMLAGVVAAPCACPKAEAAADLQRLQSALRVMNARAVIVSRQDVHTLELLGQLLPEGTATLYIEDLVSGDPVERPAVQAGEPAAMLMTSGSSGAPKLVVQTHRAILAYAQSAVLHNHFSEADVSLNWLPLEHVGGLVMFHLRDTWLACRQINVATARILERPTYWLDLIHRERVTLTWAPNFAFALVTRCAREMAAANWDLSCLRFILNGGEPIIQSHALRFMQLLRRHGLPASAMHPAWGMSETCSAATYSDEFNLELTHRESQVSVGRPVKGIALRIVDSSGVICPRGVQGALEVRGASITEGYFRNEAANSDSFTKDGWFRTGDVGLIRNDSLVVVGRSKDVIIINGLKYSCEEVEALVASVPGVQPAQIAVVGFRGGRRETDDIGILFVPDPSVGLPPEQLAEAVRLTVAENIGGSLPIVLPVAEADIPRSALGKIRRSDIREQLQRRFGSRSEQQRSGVELARLVFQPKQALCTQPPPPNVLVVSCESESSRQLSAVLGGFGCQVDCVQVVVDQKASAEAAWLDALRHHLAAPHCSGNVVFVLRRGALLESGCDGGLRTLQSVLRALKDAGRTLRLHVIAVDSPVDREACALAAIGAWLRSVCSEQPKLTATLVRLQAPLDGPRATAALREQLCCAVRDVEIIYTRDGRFVPSLCELAPMSERLRIRAGSLVLITGGAGGVGQHLAEHLLSRFGVKLLLVGRTESHGVTAGLSHGLREASARGDLLYLPADVARTDLLAAACEKAKRRFQRNLSGIFHLAGVLEGDHSGIAQSYAAVEKALAPKVQGSETVLEIARQNQVPWVVLFSSIVSVFGGATVAAHSAASAYQLYRAERLSASNSQPEVFSIAWSQWAGVGQSRGHLNAELPALLGYRCLETQRALELLDQVLTQQPGAWIAGVDSSARPLSWRFIQEPRLLESCDLSDCGRSVPERAAEEPLNAGICRVIRRVWSEALELEELDDDENLWDLGAHSLVVPRVLACLKTELNVELRARDLFRHATVRRLAKYVSDCQ